MDLRALGEGQCCRTDLNAREENSQAPPNCKVSSNIHARLRSAVAYRCFYIKISKMATMMSQASKQAVASKAQRAAPMRASAGASTRKVVSSSSTSFAGASVSAGVAPAFQAVSRRAAVQKVFAVRDGAALDRKLRVAVIGGGPSGACAAETLAKGGVEVFLIERKLDNCKVRSSFQ